MAGSLYNLNESSENQWSVHNVWKYVKFTCVFTKLDERACFNASHDDLSIHDLDPYKSVMVLSSRSSCNRLSIGFLAQPKPDIIAWNALSPLTE